MEVDLPRDPALIVQEDAKQAADKKSNHRSYPAVRPGSYSNNFSDKIVIVTRK